MPIKPIPDEHVSQTAAGITACLFKVIERVNQLIEKENARDAKPEPVSPKVGSKRKAKAIPDAKANGQDKEVG